MEHTHDAMEHTHVVVREYGYGRSVYMTGTREDCRTKAKELNAEYHTDAFRVETFRNAGF